MVISLLVEVPPVTETYVVGLMPYWPTEERHEIRG